MNQFPPSHPCIYKPVYRLRFIGGKIGIFLKRHGEEYFVTWTGEFKSKKYREMKKYILEVVSVGSFFSGELKKSVRALSNNYDKTSIF